MRKFHYFITLIAGILLCGCVCSQNYKKDTVFQYSTINALLDGFYDGEISIEKLKKKGDFGIGTFNHLNGEMVVLDGHFYQIKSDGSVVEVGPSVKSPFVVLSFFEPEQDVFLKDGLDLEGLEAYLDSLLPNLNYFSAIKIEGQFSFIQTRSVPSQNRPYRPLVEIVKDQPKFEFKNVEGTLVGFRFPEYMKGLNVGGYHFHFISKDKLSGGHLLACSIGQVRIFVDQMPRYCLELPQSPDFALLDLAPDKEEQLRRVEK
ncbi:MAG: acetolactate decarboxylase [Candidatus Omnitrophota bacterium]